MNVSQKKYGQGFSKDLSTSHELVGLVRRAFEKFDRFLVLDKFDDKPFTNERTGDAVRLADAMVFDRHGEVLPVFAECKDIGRLVCWDSTGLPRRYVDERMAPLGPSSMLFVFRDNEQALKEIADHKGVSVDEAAAKLRFCESSPSGRIFLPYGGFLSRLMLCRDSWAELKVPCNFRGFWGERQYIWDLSAMQPIHEIAAGLASGDKRV